MLGSEIWKDKGIGGRDKWCKGGMKPVVLWAVLVLEVREGDGGFDRSQTWGWIGFYFGPGCWSGLDQVREWVGVMV